MTAGSMTSGAIYMTAHYRTKENPLCLVREHSPPAGWAAQQQGGGYLHDRRLHDNRLYLYYSYSPPRLLGLQQQGGGYLHNIMEPRLLNAISTPGETVQPKIDSAGKAEVASIAMDPVIPILQAAYY